MKSMRKITALVLSILMILTSAPVTVLTASADECAHDGDFGYAEVKVPTCLEPGYSGDKVCNLCGETVAYGSEIPATGHNSRKLKETVSATCAHYGYEVNVCADCGMLQKNDTVAYTGHSPGAATGTVSACSIGDFTVHKCDDCEKTVLIQTSGVTKAHSFAADGICTACGVSEYVADNYEYSFSSFYGGLVIYDFFGDNATENIPSYIEGIPVKVINSLAFKGSRATEITVPDTVVHIDGYAFADSMNLTKVTVADSVEVIGAGAFSCCYALSEAILPAGLKFIPERLFEHCYELADVNIPDNLSFIGDEAFGDSAIEEVSLPESIYHIGMRAFRGCAMLTEITLPEAVDFISAQTFSGCESLKKAVLGENVTVIGIGAFEGCRELAEINFPEALEVIADNAFAFCYGLSYIVLSDGLRKIGDNAFPNAELWHVWFSGTEEDYRAIEKGDYNDGLWNATVHFGYSEPTIETEIIPATCEYEGYTKIICTICDVDTRKDYTERAAHQGYFVETVPPTCSYDGFDNYYCEVCRSNYSQNWVDSIPHQGTKLDDFPASCEEAAYTLYYCSVCEQEYKEYDESSESTGHTLTVMKTYSTCSWGTVNESYCSVCEKTYFAADGNGSEHNFTDGECTACGVKDYFSYILEDECGGICIQGLNGDGYTVIDIPEAIEGIPVKKIDGWAMCYRDITRLTLPEGLEYIGNSAFAGNPVAEVIIPDTVKVIDSQAFRECDKLRTVTLPDGLTELEIRVFADCTSLYEINIPASCEKIGESAFDNCRFLSSVILPEGLLSIERQAFGRCTKLSYVYIPASVSRIGEYAFDGAELLSHIYYGGTEEQFNAIDIGNQECYFDEAVVHYGQTEADFEIINTTAADCINDGKSTLKCNVCDGEFVGNFRPSEGHTMANPTVVGNTCSFGEITKGTCSVCSNDVYAVEKTEYWNHEYDEDGICSVCGESDDFSYEFDSMASGLYINGYSGDAEELVIPAEFENIPVKYVTQMQNNSFTKLTVSEGITKLSEWAFDCNYKLKEVVLPEGLTEIGDGAFAGCYKLEKINLPASVKKIGAAAFSECEKLDNIVLPEGLEEIEDATFSCCRSLTEIDIPDTVKHIGESAFLSCTSLGAIELPEGLLSIGRYAFTDCNTLSEIVISGGVQEIGEGAFSYCGLLYSAAFGEGITEIPDRCFVGCHELKIVVLPSTLEEIGDEAFNGNIWHIWTALSEEEFAALSVGTDNSGLESNELTVHTECDEVNVSVTVEQEPTCQQQGYCKLVCAECKENESDYAESNGKVTNSLPHSGELIKTVAPTCTENGYDKRICDICYREYSDNNIPSLGHDREDAPSDSFAALCSFGRIDKYLCNRCNMTIYSIGEGNAEGHSFADGACTVCGVEEGLNYYLDTELGGIIVSGGREGAEAVTIPEKIEGIPVVGIGSWSFNNAELKEIELPSTIKYIGEYAFFGAEIEEISLPEGIKKLGDSCFEACTELQEISLPDSLEIIGRSAFSGCSALERVQLPANLTELPVSCFADCSELTEITVPDTVESFGEYCFCNCVKLKTVNMPSALEYIGEGAFSDCSSLEIFALPETLSIIGIAAFNGCRALTEIEIPEACEKIGHNAFCLCENLEYVKLPSQLKIIPDYLFSDCVSLKEIEIPGTVTEIGEGAFNWCYSLEEAILPEGLEEIGCRAFSNCYALKTAVIPDSVEIMGEQAFFNCEKIHTLVLGEGITEIPEAAFENCYSLVFVYLPEGIEGICARAFDNCYEIDHIWTAMSQEEYDGITIEGNNDLNSVTVHYEQEAIACTVENSVGATCTYFGYDVISCDICKVQNIEDAVWNIETEELLSHSGSFIKGTAATCTESGYMLYSCDVCESEYEEIIEPLGHIEGEPLREFDTCSFGTVTEYHCSRCDGNYYVTNEQYAEQHFIGEEGLCIKCGVDTNLGYHYSFTHSGIMVTGYYGEAESLVIPAAIEGIPVTAIEDEAFCDGSFADVELPDSISYIGGYAFARCTNLKEINIPASLKRLAACVFYKCSALTAIELPEGLEYIGDSTFAECTSLSSIEFPDSLSEIYVGAFYGCKALSAVALPEGLESISDGCFDGCTALKVIYIPSAVETIEEYSFFGCDALSHIFYGGSEAELEELIENGGGYVVCGEGKTVHCEQSGIALTKGDSFEADCSADGYTEYTCDICQSEMKLDLVPKSEHSFENNICTGCDAHYFDCIESDHPYNSNENREWVINIPGAEKIYITFSQDTYTEDNYDFISIYDGDSDCIGEYSGGYLAGNTLEIEGDTAVIVLRSDGSVQDWGFKVTRIGTEAPSEEEETTEAEETTTEAAETTTEAEETTTEAEETTTEAEETTTEAEETTTEAEETTTEAEETTTEAEETTTEAEETTTEAEETTTEAEETTTEAEETTTEAEETTTEAEETTTEAEECSHFAQQYWTIVNPASCFGTGLKVILCDVCREPLERETIPQRAHNMQPTGVTVAGNCKDDGYAEYACAYTERTDEYLECNHTENVNTGKNLQNHKNPVTTLTGAIKPTCVTQGYSGNIVHSCCGAVKVEGGVLPVDKTAHEPEDAYTVTKTATCTEKGREAILCSLCDEIIAERETRFDADKHTGKADTVKNKKTATCTEKGYTGDTYWSCCDAPSKKGTETAKDTSKHTGTVKLTGNKAASCTADGYTGDKAYSCCGKITEKGSVIKATGHSYSQFAVVKEPSVTEEGRSERVCSVCKAVDGVAIPKIQKIEVESTEEIKVTEDIPDVFVFETVTAEKLAESLPSAAEIITKDGETAVEDAPLATGMKIVIKDGDKIIDEKIVVVPFDVDGDAKSTAADARLALRESVGLENLEDYQKSAADVDEKSKENNISAADARLILRASVGLEDKEEWFKENF